MERAIFRHPALDFASIHAYEQGTIDDPQNTVDAAIAMGRIVRRSVAEIEDGRPFLDSEHGPIHSFKDLHRTLPAPFDDEYFRHMQWAHLASGGAGGGMRWPNRNPHTLTPGMRLAQRGLARFLPLIDWLRFDRRSLTDPFLFTPAGRPVRAAQVAQFGCASRDQAVLYLLRRDTLAADGRVTAAAGLPIGVRLPDLEPGPYRVSAWDTVSGTALDSTIQTLDGRQTIALPPLVTDMAVAVRKKDFEFGLRNPKGRQGGLASFPRAMPPLSVAPHASAQKPGECATHVGLQRQVHVGPAVEGHHEAAPLGFGQGQAERDRPTPDAGRCGPETDRNRQRRDRRPFRPRAASASGRTEASRPPWSGDGPRRRGHPRRRTAARDVRSRTVLPGAGAAARNRPDRRRRTAVPRWRPRAGSVDRPGSPRRRRRVRPAPRRWRRATRRRARRTPAACPSGRSCASGHRPCRSP